MVAKGKPITKGAGSNAPISGETRGGQNNQGGTSSGTKSGSGGSGGKPAGGRK